MEEKIGTEIGFSRLPWLEWEGEGEVACPKTLWLMMLGLANFSAIFIKKLFLKKVCLDSST